MHIDKKRVKRIVEEYTTVVKVVESDAHTNSDRSYGGMVRSVKGKLQEHITDEIIRAAWDALGGMENRIEINSKKFFVPLARGYASTIQDEEIRKYIEKNRKKYRYPLSVDKQVFIDGRFVLGIECKAYAENAMLKRIVVDFHLLKKKFPDLSCWVFQLESQLGGDYSRLKERTFGSSSTHTILSYFKDVDLHIFTFLEGERLVDKPIHRYFKPLSEKRVEDAIRAIAEEMSAFV